MKLRRKSDGLVKDVPEDKAQKFLSNPDFEQVQDSSVRSPDSESNVDQGGFMSSVGDGMRGVVQGGTLGFSDEAVGAVSATLDKLTGGSKDWTDLYREYQQAEQARNKAAQEASPILYGGGEIVGGVGAGLLSGGASAATMGLRQAAKIGAGEVAKTLGKGALIGATAGGVQSAGTSEGNLDSIESRAKLVGDIKSGAELGGAVGIAAPIAGAAISKYVKDPIVKKAEGHPAVKQFLDVFKRGETNAAVSGTETGIRNAENTIASTRAGVVDTIMGADDVLGAQFGDLVDKATLNGTKVSLQTPTINSLAAINQLGTNPVIASTAEFGKLQGLVNKLSSFGHLTPREAIDLKDLANTLAKKYPKEQIGGIAGQIAGDITEAIGDVVPGFEKANSLIAGFRDAVPDQLLGKRLSSVKGDVIKVLGGKVDAVLQGYRSGVEAAIPSRETISAISKKLSALEAQNPGLLESLGIGSPEIFEKMIRDGSDEYGLIGKLLKGGSSLFNQGGLKNDAIKEFSTIKKGVYGAAQLMGATKRKAGEMFNAPLDMVNGYATTLGQSQNKMAQDVGKYLADAVANKDQFKKNSALFIINQNPALKEILGFGSEGEE